MTCPDENHLVAFSEARLSGADLEHFNQHLDACPSCRRQVMVLMQSAASRSSTPYSTLPDIQSIPRGTSVGRYIIMERIGMGGMGVVYSAFDPELDRKIALKLLRSTRDGNHEARARFLREAQAMANLSHPNITAVHDVGTFGEQAFFAMEFVRGCTLRQWLKQAPRSPREILSVFMDAGRGLAVAHAAGIIHRDFKPDNVLVGLDGRARVTDFGLALAATQTPLRGSVSGDTPLANHTVPGALLGTPVYMAPEQHAGQRVDERADQFAFCVALYEAWYGTRPFSGETLDALRAEVLAGRVRMPPATNTVHAIQHRALVKGLALDPSQRHPSMDALLSALARQPVKVRRLVLAGTVMVAMLVGTLSWSTWMHRQERLCQGAEALMQEAWSPQRGEAVRQAFMATGKSFATHAWTQVQTALETHAAQWIAMRTQACQATRVHGEQSEEVMDLRMACMERKRQEMKALVDVFAQADHKVVEKAVTATGRLGGMDECADVDLLRTPVRPPTLDVKSQVATARERAAVVKANFDAGRYKQARTLVHELAKDSLGLGYKPLHAEVMSMKGEIEYQAGAYDDAQQSLLQAVMAARASNHVAMEIPSLMKLTHLLGVLQRQPDKALILAQLASAAMEQMGVRPEHELRLEATLSGVYYWGLGQHDQALQHARRAMEIAKATQASPTWLAGLHNVVAGVLGDQGRYREALEEQQRSHDLAATALGADHPEMAIHTKNLGNALFSMGDLEGAQALFKRAYANEEGELGAEHPNAAMTLANMGHILTWQHKDKEALELYALAIPRLRAGLGASHPRVALALTFQGRSLLQLGQHSQALQTFQQAAALVEKNPSVHFLASALSGLGQSQLNLGHPQDARATLERSLQLFEKTGAFPDPRAETRFALARALWVDGARRAEAQTHALAAKQRLEQPGLYQRLLPEVLHWLETHAMRE